MTGNKNADKVTKTQKYGNRIVHKQLQNKKIPNEWYGISKINKFVR